MPKVGDIIEIPLSAGRRAYCQYVCRDIKNGPMIQVFKEIVNGQEVDFQNVIRSGKLFPPVITGINIMVRKGFWKVVGKAPIEDFIYPKFIASNWNTITGIVEKWYLWDGEKYSDLGPKLPNQYKTLEFLVVWSPFTVVDRIETGNYPFPYNELIAYNKIISERKMNGS